jgi:hypothetical protein
MPRRLIQRAFLNWLDENRPRFALEINLGRRTDTDLDFSFAGITGAISGVLTTWEINVLAMHEQECWDFLLSLDAIPKRAPGGYVCDLCPPESRPVFPDRPALWTDHLFEPFIAWVNDDLAKAKWLALHGSPGFTWAKLLPEDAVSPAREPPEERAILLPCRAP